VNTFINHGWKWNWFE